MHTGPIAGYWPNYVNLFKMFPRSISVRVTRVGLSWLQHEQWVERNYVHSKYLYMYEESMMGQLTASFKHFSNLLFGSLQACPYLPKIGCCQETGHTKKGQKERHFTSRKKMKKYVDWKGITTKHSAPGLQLISQVQPNVSSMANH